MPVKAPFSAPLQALFVPKQFKVLWGGRGAGRSWGISDALILGGDINEERVLCVRELQKSIEDSVHRDLSESINRLGMDNIYAIEKAKIFHRYKKTSFSFEGIKNNVNAIKSYSGITKTWVEEANKVTKHSWSVLLPTVFRMPNSEVWISFNPELEDDYTYSHFILDETLEEVNGQIRFAEPVFCPIKENATTITVKMSYRDNPWFPEKLAILMEQDKRNDYDHYLNIWEGNIIRHLQGAVYAKELRKATVENRITAVPYVREIPVDTFWDLGRADNTAIWFIQRVALQWRVLAYYEASGQELTHFLSEIQRREYVYGTMFLPHDARHKRLGYHHSIEERIRLAGYRVRIAPMLSRMEGINATRAVFPSCWFDEVKCADGLSALRRYRYRVIDGKLSNDPLHDSASDGADAFRCFAVTTSDIREELPERAQRLTSRLTSPIKSFIESNPGLGWMR